MKERLSQSETLVDVLRSSLLHSIHNLETWEAQDAVMRAVYFSEHVHATDPPRRNGDAYIVHPFRMTQTLFEANVTDEQILLATLLHDTIESAVTQNDTCQSQGLTTNRPIERTFDVPGGAHAMYERLRHAFGDDVAALVDFLSILSPSGDLDHYEEFLKQNIGQDPRVAVVKTVDVLDNTLDLEFSTKNQLQKYCLIIPALLRSLSSYPDVHSHAAAKHLEVKLRSRYSSIREQLYVSFLANDSL